MPTQNTRHNRSKWCFSLRQWAFLFSVIIFVITAVLTTCAALGKMHTQDVWELVKADLAEEHERNEYAHYGKHYISPNEAKLHYSQHIVIVLIWVLHICTWVGCLNLLASVLLIYGIATRSSIYIMPWIVISGTSYLLAVTSILVYIEYAYFEYLPGMYISFNTLVIGLTSSTIFIVIWYTILLYYSTLTATNCSSRYPSITPTIIQAYGGYMHALSPTLSREKKQMV